MQYQMKYYKSYLSFNMVILELPLSSQETLILLIIILFSLKTHLFIIEVNNILLKIMQYIIYA